MRIDRAEWRLPGDLYQCAITRFYGVDYACNLHTGVDKRCRGRKLGQAVKVQALRFARDVLKVNSVRTFHSTKYRSLPST
ncbi:MAG: hypothetical protein ACYC11_06580, partial [Bellilinea sp.]